jgi:broad specificity phosphatase PhoE
LSPRGREQASALASALGTTPFTHAFSSDLSRALETANAICARHRGLRPSLDARLREFDFGQWEGLTWPEIATRWPELLERRPTQARLYEPPEGERFDQVTARVASFIASLEPLGAQARVLAVAHAGTLHAALAALRPEGIDPLGIVFSTASFTRIAMEGGRARIISLNDVDHLDSIA